MSTKTYTIIGMEFQLEDSMVAEQSVDAINSNYDSLVKTNPDMDEPTAMLSMLLRAGLSRYYIPKGTPSTSIELKVIHWAFQITTTELGKEAIQEVEDDLNKLYAKMCLAYPDKSFEELSRIMLFQLYYPSWETIERCVEVASTRNVNQTEIVDFLKGTFNIALDALDGLVQSGIELSDKDVIKHLMSLREAIYLLPTQRVYCMDAPDAVNEFREQESRFYQLLSIPKQNAENSFSADWVIGGLSYLKKQFDELELLRDKKSELEDLKEDMIEGEVSADIVQERVNSVRSDIERLEHEISEAIDANMDIYIHICHNLLEGGSEKIGAEILDASSDIAEVFMSEGMFSGAREMLQIAIGVLREENPRIQQREARLSVMRRSLETAEKPFK